jgi:DNA helicase-2/ATP-dependent DNA helicase PcrA
MSPDDLTPSQRAAVEHFEGPLLVLAGPGSGKTRVITRRIARLVERGVSPWEILAITFTNKAAREMGERVRKLLPRGNVWVSTFHKFCARLLRERGEAVGLKPNFSIFDTSDQHQLIKEVLHDENIDATHYPPGKVGQRISAAKNELITPELYLARRQERVGMNIDALVARVYPKYQQRLLAANAVDFDDILVHVARLLEEQPDLRAQLDERHRFILVDEYQDTNQAQYQIVASLSQDSPNLCATGDPDQSIYGWRGAQVENILRFERDFPSVKVIRLEDNFRSTPEILAAADELIAHNVRRKIKQLRTENPNGDPVELRLYADGWAEAQGIAQEIRDLVEEGERNWSDFAIFYRVNALSRTLETTLARHRIPHQIAGGVAFYERAEIKDLLCYLRLIENPADRAAFLRVVNKPARGIGKTSLDRLVQWANASNRPLLEAARLASDAVNVPKKAAVGLQRFAGLIGELSQLASGAIEPLLRQIVLQTQFDQQWEAGSEEEAQRLSNVGELISAAGQYDKEFGAETSLSGFLETATLAQDVDSLAEGTGAVTLMTLHSAKGLEFPCVYLVGVEQNLLPHERVVRQNDPRQYEEERRLLFVGITRAKQRLVLTHTMRRELHGRSLSTIPSDFLGEIRRLANRDCTDVDASFDVEQFEADDESAFGAGDSAFDAAESAFGGDSAFGKTAENLERRTPNAERRAAGRGSSDPASIRRESPDPAEARPQVSAPSRRLTTGAALAAGKSQPVEMPIGFAPGMTVRHPRYGLGTVVDVSGLSRHRIVTVEFEEGDRREKFIASKCPLQPVGVR